jgi:hypothetical protein
MHVTLRSRSLATLAMAAVLAMTPSPAAAQNRPEPLKRVHVLIASDTNSNLSAFIQISRDNLVALLRSTIPSANLDLVQLEGDQLTPENIVAHYQRLETGPDECVVFFYSGHGGTDANRGHYIWPNQHPLLRSDLLAAMKQKNPGLVVCLTDCCSSLVDLKRPARPARRVRRADPPAAIQPLMLNLFFQHRGVVDITAAERGTEGWYDSEVGGMFGSAFVNLAGQPVESLDADRDGFVSWQEFFPKLRAETNAVFLREKPKWNSPPEQAAQYPQVFALPESNAAGRRPVAAPAYRLGARVQAAGPGMKVEKVTPGSPAARLGLEAGDVILSVNGQPVRSQADYARLLDHAGGRVRLEILNGRDGKKIIRDNVMLEPVR